MPVVLVLVAPFVFAHKLRFDRHPPIPHFRAVSADLKGMIKKGDKLFVVDPRESGASGIIARYELLPLGAFSGWHGVFHPRSEDIYRNIFFKNSFSHLLVYSTVPVMLKVIDMALEERTTYFAAIGRQGRLAGSAPLESTLGLYGKKEGSVPRWLKLRECKFPGSGGT